MVLFVMGFWRWFDEHYLIKSFVVFPFFYVDSFYQQALIKGDKSKFDVLRGVDDSIC